MMVSTQSVAVCAVDMELSAELNCLCSADVLPKRVQAGSRGRSRVQQSRPTLGSC